MTERLESEQGNQDATNQGADAKVELSLGVVCRAMATTLQQRVDDGELSGVGKVNAQTRFMEFDQTLDSADIPDLIMSFETELAKLIPDVKLTENSRWALVDSIQAGDSVQMASEGVLEEMRRRK